VIARLDEPAAVGLRDRKKTRRRDEIIQAARRLFGQNGIDATTMAEIAEAAEVSPPTVFNYFGNKDGILIAMIADGAAEARRTDTALRPRTDAAFDVIVIDMLTQVAARTLDIASKRVWRYAEAASIRHPTTELSRKYELVNKALLGSLEEYLGLYALTLRSGEPADIPLLARMIYDIWTGAYLELLRDQTMDLAAHRAALVTRLAPLLRLLFAPAFCAAPTLS